MKRRGGGRGRLPVRSEINVTSLVDVAFTLLVIFIITAPVLQGGIEVNVPEGHVEVVEATDDMVRVTVTEDHTIFVGEAQVAEVDLPEILAQIIQENGADRVYLWGDSLAVYGRVAAAISAVAAQEGVGLSLILQEIRR
ncbi:MAG: biopolymer transporter ExbD [Gemmatimonadetes bacterium]|nr:biopolymer transporter ExbD [Gemmatimonadota bacterium]MCY3612256.1 biopolymer transporter ExbD [Gemmatimonadota bacterium]MCY3679495.1 biopolymer transporter ExbD [Gemmatimonadota bacterium]MYA41967.1 biopolymer transporter ExbD [Gemmatimonadota bacterium]MYE94884.1 biopolymer transporter ExbD [Gemmatimonadota bacterium]